MYQLNNTHNLPPQGVIVGQVPCVFLIQHNMFGI